MVVPHKPLCTIAETVKKKQALIKVIYLSHYEQNHNDNMEAFPKLHLTEDSTDSMFVTHVCEAQSHLHLSKQLTCSGNLPIICGSCLQDWTVGPICHKTSGLKNDTVDVAVHEKRKKDL